MVRRYVVTGAPGAGKTVLVAGLRARGVAVVAEAATDVIAASQAEGVEQPWTQAWFCDRIAVLQRKREIAAVAGSVTEQVFDRSPLCTLALAHYLDQPVGPVLAGEVDRVVRERVYESVVFLVRPLGFVEATAARRISYPESLVFERVHETVYREHGFRLVDIPPGPVPARVDQVLSLIGRRQEPEGAAADEPG